MKEEKKQRFPNQRSLLKYFLRGSAHWFALGILCACMSSLLDLVNPRIIAYTVDAVIGNKETAIAPVFQHLVDAAGGVSYMHEHLYLIAVLVIVIALVRAVFRYCFTLFNTKGAEKLVQTMRNDLFSHIMRLPFSWYGENQTGDIIQRCTSDVETIKVFLSEQLTGFFRTVIMLVLSLYFMFSIHAKLAWAAFAFIPVIIAYSFFFHTRIGDSFEKADVEEGKLSSIAQENLTGVRVVRAFGRESYERQRFEKQNDSYTKYWVKLMKILAMFWCSGDLVSYMQVLVILVLGTGYAVKGELSAGSLIAFITYNNMLTWPVRALGRVISEMSKAGISIDRLREVMNAEEEKDVEHPVKPDMHQDITFDHVSYSYENGSAEVLHDIGFTIKAGTTVGILGGTGSGKSTLMYLLARLYDLPENGGRILIGDTDIRNIERDYIRKNIGMVLQEPFLFSRTLEENISIALDHPDHRQVRDAARTASLDETIGKFDKGYETYVGERGVTLSGGQKQRTAIAQMLIRKPPVMVFDDSLSAVDAETDSRIRAALKEKTADSTVILIAHRITTLMNADQIIVMNHGRVVETGSHEELMENHGIYRRIYDLQAQGMEG
ncbi:MAG: ABC transporter ATP-binding protein [Bulleidia sp.]|nr:ABC transporter ATP-binding protein [Bulleidia sp.]